MKGRVERREIQLARLAFTQSSQSVDRRRHQSVLTAPFDGPMDADIRYRSFGESTPRIAGGSKSGRSVPDEDMESVIVNSPDPVSAKRRRATDDATDTRRVHPFRCKVGPGEPALANASEHPAPD